MAEHLKFEIRNRIGIITLNRPEKRNALNKKLIVELITAFKKAEDNKEVKVLLLKAAGESFSAGADLADLQQLQGNSYEENLDDSNDLRYLFSTIYCLEKPVIAQVEGNAIAGGCGLATVCDIVFAAPEARFGYTEVKIGFVPALVSAFLIRRIGEGRSRELLLTANLISAETARSWGLVNFIENKADIDDKVFSYASQLAESTSSEAVCTTKNLLARLHHLSIEESLELAVRVNAKARLTDDCKKGIEAFLTKKSLKW